MRNKIVAAVLLAMLLCRCGAKQKKDEMPEDTPCNHGRGLIMEGDKGYYTDRIFGNDNKISLRYYEKDSESQVFLCAKPECTHNGSEACPATYKGLECIHSLIYDGALYTLLLDKGETVTLSLYRAALDGTSLTKVGDVFTAGNQAGEKEIKQLDGQYFIIHKGYAYIPYHITIGEGTFGFAGGGLVKMDISNGSTEEIYTGEKYFSAFPYQLQGNGDQIYFVLRSYNYSSTPDDGTYFYDIKSGETSKIIYGIMDLAVDDDNVYIRGMTEEPEGSGKNAVFTCDKDKLLQGSGLEDGLTYFAGSFDEPIDRIAVYEDMVLAAHGGVISIYGKDGGALGEIKCPEELMEVYPYFAVSNGKIYIDDFYYPYHNSEYYKEKYHEPVFSCLIDDIVNGGGEWKFEYGIMDTNRVENKDMVDYDMGD